MMERSLYTSPRSGVLASDAMRARRSLAVAALSMASTFARPALAQHFDWRAALTGAATYNKVLTDAPYPTALTTSGPSATLSPSISLVYDTPRTSHTFTYAFGMNFLFTKDFEVAASGISYNNRGNYQGRFQLSEISSITLGISVTHQPARSLSVGSDASQTIIDPVPSSAAYLLGSNLQETFTRQMSEETSLSQNANVLYNSPHNPLLVLPSTLGVQLGFSLQRQFTRDTLGVQVSAQGNYFTIGEGTGGVVIEPRVQFSNSLSLTWNRPFTETLTSALVFGITQVVSPAFENPIAFQPTGSLSLTYRLEPVVISASYAHQGAPNLSTGAVNFMDSGSLRLSVPVGDTGLATSGTGGFTHMLPVGQSNVGSSSVFMGDLGLTYRPPISDALSLGLRGQVQRQAGGADASQSFTRLSVSFSLTYAYPSANAAQPGPELPPTLGSAIPVGPSSGGFGSSFEGPSEVELPPETKP
jgi:hypothetical protein